jgi:protein gp37
VGDRTKISWTDASWNPVRGCSRVSEGCRHCYAERVAARFSGPGQPYEGLVRIGKRSKGIGATGPMPRVPLGWNGVVRLVPDHLADPLRWRRPRRVFVNSMSDLFHEALTNEQVAAVFGVMAAAPRHTFQALTKRARRMREWFAWATSQPVPVRRLIEDAALAVPGALETIPKAPPRAPWPLPNVWLGVSVENQAAADERIPELLATPAAVRFLSCEPLLGAVNLRHLDAEAAGHGDMIVVDALTGRQTDMGRPCADVARVDWVIAGCESGPGARPCDVAWLRSLRDQCMATAVAFFLKQAVGYGSTVFASPAPRDGITDGPDSKRKPGGVVELPYLDGVKYAAFPEVRP